MIKLFPVLLLLSLSVQAIAQRSTGFTLVEKKDKRQVDVLFNNKLLTAYCNFDSGRKPVLFPVSITHSPFVLHTESPFIPLLL